jgi:hypothetical protein
VAGIEANEKRLKEYCAYVLERQPMPAKGSRKLTGADGSMLMLKGNGGVQALTVDGYAEGKFSQDSPLPVEYRKVTVQMPLSLYIQIEREFDLEKYAPVIAAEPDQAVIRKDLASDCEACNGTGKIDAPEALRPCNGCGGDGKKRVPGARLADRGFHVEVK